MFFHSHTICQYLQLMLLCEQELISSYSYKVLQVCSLLFFCIQYNQMSIRR